MDDGHPGLQERKDPRALHVGRHRKMQGGDWSPSQTMTARPGWREEGEPQVELGVEKVLKQTPF